MLPLEILENKDHYTAETHRAVEAACREAGTNQVIVRTSEPTDFQGMVDAMPTMVVDIEEWFARIRIAHVIADVRRRCAHPDVLRYAQVEGFGYDPNRITVSVAPFLQCTRGLITEHPNQDGVVLVDKETKGVHISADFSNSAMSWYDGPPEQYDRLLPIQKWLRNTGILDPKIAYQFEVGIQDGKIVLFQIREFAKRVEANFKIDPSNVDQQKRTFGVTPEEGIEAVVARAESRELLYRNVLPKIPNGQPFILAPVQTSPKLGIKEIPDPRIIGYATRHAPALSHQSTRFVQAALRHQNGFAQLMDIEHFYKRYREGLPRVRVICDGATLKVDQL